MGVKMSTANAASGETSRDRILAAALDLLQREGAIALTVRNIAEAAGCSTSGIYTHFGGKHGLVEALYLDGFANFHRALQPFYDTQDLLGVGLEYRRWALANRTHYLIMFGRAVPEFEPGEEAKAEATLTFQAWVDALTPRALGDPVAAAYHLYCCAHGYVMLELIEFGPIDNDLRSLLYEGGLLSAATSVLSPE
jgi:AcrR family transcriptional regulator